jgi:hypothetical protein
VAERIDRSASPWAIPAAAPRVRDRARKDAVKAQSRSRSFYTERGPGASTGNSSPRFAPKAKSLCEPSPLPEEIVTVQPIDVIQNRPAPLEEVVRPRCEHGGDIVDGVPFCGICFSPVISKVIAEEKNKKLRVRGHTSVVPGFVGEMDVQIIPYDTWQEGAAAGFQIFLHSLFNLCGRVAWRNRFRAISYDDRRNQAFWAVWSNLRRIRKADNPFGMATRIAERAITDMKRNPVYYREWSESQLNVAAASDDPEMGPELLENDFEKLGNLSFRSIAVQIRLETGHLDGLSH